MARLRSEVVKLAESWVGLKESDGSFKKIIDIYNSYRPLPRLTKMEYSWAWCAATWSALAIKLGYADIMPIEMSCAELIKLAKLKRIWVEDDGYVPKIGDAVLYDWNDTGIADCTGAPDHVGVVSYVNPASGYFVVIEGNYSDSVKKRTMAINGRYIRGFITPKYDEENIQETTSSDGNRLTIDQIAHEVITGKWGKGAERQKKLEASGHNYQEVQARVNQILNGSAATPVLEPNYSVQPTSKKVTATERAQKKMASSKNHYTTSADLYLRNGPGTNKKALCLMPKATILNWYGYYSEVGKTLWYYVTANINGVQYTGFCCASYLR